MRVRLCVGRDDARIFAGFDALVAQRGRRPTPSMPRCRQDIADEDLRRVQRQAFAGMLWSKQFYGYDVAEWLDGDPRPAAAAGCASTAATAAGAHLNAADIISMPDKWEYPWFAAWDLAFHCVSLSLIDPDSPRTSSCCLCEVLDDASQRRAAGL